MLQGDAPLSPLVRSEFRDRVRAARQACGREWPADECERYESHLRTLLGSAEISKRGKLDVLALILEEGRFKTRYEPGCLPSGNPPRCAVEEAQVWNVAPEALVEMPTFGYAATIDDVAAPGHAPLCTWLTDRLG